MNRVLVFSPGSLQEQLLLFPSLAALSSNHVDVVVPPEAKELYRLSAHVQQVIPFALESSKGLADWSNLYGVAREQEYDSALTISPSLPIRFVLWLLGIRTRIGVTGGVGEFLLTHAIPSLDHLSKIHAYRDLVKVMNANPVEGLALSIPDDAAKWSHNAYQSLGVDSETNTILICDELEDTPSTSYAMDSWSSVIRGIRDRHPDLQIVLLGTNSNHTWIEEMQEQLLGIPIIQTKTLAQTAAVIHQSQALVSSDTASLYLGIGSNCPVVGLFGHHKPELYLPESDRIIGLRANSGNIQDIAPIQVIESVSQLCG